MDAITQLIALRKAQGVSRREIGRRIGQTIGALSKLESGETKLKVDTAAAYARALGARAFLVVATDEHDLVAVGHLEEEDRETVSALVEALPTMSAHDRRILAALLA